MTTKELENKLKISTNTCIHCPTLELAKQVLSIFHQLGLRWFSGEYYTLNHNWDILKKNTVYYPFDGLFSPLKYAQQNDYKIISAQKFIGLHTEEFNLENYEPKGQLIGFPKEIIARMLDCQEEQGNPRDVSVFEKYKFFPLEVGGFSWSLTEENNCFWYEISSNKNFDIFFKKYPKQDNSQEFRLGDKVYDIILGEIGIVKNIILNNVSAFPIEVYYESCGIVLYALEGKYLSNDKYPKLLHYRDDYDYSVIDFNNLPKRQEPKRWRAEKGQRYYYIDKLFEVSSFMEENHITDTKLYNLGNYFQTEKEAQEVADIIKKCFQELINQNK